MSQICELCGKGPVSGNNVSHSKRRTKRRFLPNLIVKRFGSKKCRICTRCLRTLQKVARAAQQAVDNKLQKTESK